jgi:hypothetical protein
VKILERQVQQEFGGTRVVLKRKGKVNLAASPLDMMKHTIACNIVVVNLQTKIVI